MVKQALLVVSIFLLLLVIDVIWLKFIVGDFFFRESQSFARVSGERFDVVVWAALVVWVAMAIGLNVFVLQNAQSYVHALWLGMLFGCVLYAVFDFTNFSFIEGYSIKFVLVDVLWGTFLCGTVSLAAFFIREKLFSL